jgi:hypothetical protein
LTRAASGSASATRRSAADLGAHYAANNIVLASFASQLLDNALVPPLDDRAGRRTPSDEMDDELYGVAGCNSHVTASLRCPSQSGATAVWSSSKKSYDICTSADGPVTVPAHDTYHLVGAGLSDAGGLHYPLAACSGANASTAVVASELSLTLCSNSNSIASSNNTLNATEQCSSRASRSALTELQWARSRMALHFAAVVARSRYTAVLQDLLNDVAATCWTVSLM